MSLKRGIEKAVAAAVQSIHHQAKRSRSSGDRTGRCHLGGGRSIGEVLADAIDKVGKDGTVTVEESNTFGWSSSSPRACSSTRVSSRRTS